MTCDLLRTIDLIWANFSPQEVERRREIHRRIHALPDPWWKNVRPEALTDHDTAPGMLGENLADIFDDLNVPYAFGGGRSE